MADADIVRVIITKVPEGFSVAVVLRRGERVDMWGINSVASFDEAEVSRKRSRYSTTYFGITSKCFPGS